MITDEMIADASVELNEAMIKSLPDPHECKHQFSRKFERKMKKLLYRVKHPVWYMVLSSVARILLAAMLGFAMLMSFSPTAHAAVFDWIKPAYEPFCSYYFEKDVDKDSSYRYQIDSVQDVPLCIKQDTPL